jgi:hypothetical protein
MLRYTFFDASGAVKLVLNEEMGVNHVLQYFGNHAGICITSLCFMETLRVLKTNLQKKEYLTFATDYCKTLTEANHGWSTPRWLVSKCSRTLRRLRFDIKS